MALIYSFSTKDNPSIKEVGGKAMSLIRMTGEGFSVPPGFVLTVSFFEEWLKEIRKNPAWNDIVKNAGKSIKEPCTILKKACKNMMFDDSQKQELKPALHTLMQSNPDLLFAVRSSSPEEDLESASFAGGYETSLGVTGENLEQAVRHSFASAFDERVFLYKKEHGFSYDNPRIAIIVQSQVASDTSGVAFSLNPLNNCYDECVINANRGLGESVVAGLVTPDSFIVDKISMKIIERKTGSKGVSIMLKSGGGTETINTPGNGESCLTEKQVLDITDLTARVESFYKKPIDIEWAFHNGVLSLLQARPITTHIPIPGKMVTPPGEPKKMYMDFTLIAQGVSEPISVLGMEFFDIMQKTFMNSLLGLDAIDLENGFLGSVEGRNFMNLSNVLKIPKGDTLAFKIGRYDRLLDKILRNFDRKTYLSFKTPEMLKGFLFKAIKNTLGFMKSSKLAYQDPELYKNRMLNEKEKLFLSLKKLAEDKEVSIGDFTHKIICWYTDFVNNHSLKLTTASHSMAMEGMKKLIKKGNKDNATMLNHLERGLPDNVTIEMGLTMYRLSRFKDIKECKDGREFEKRLKERNLSEEFLKSWDDFVENYGFRCPRELDLATRRPYEQPALVFKQLSHMALNEDADNNAESVFKAAWQKREQAYQTLLSGLKGKKAEQFKKHYHVWITLGGYREIHKYIMIKMTAELRKRVLEVAGKLVQQNRLDTDQQIFDLTCSQVESALKDPSINLRELGAENTLYRRKTAHIKDFPLFFDSRGKIIRPPKRKIEKGEIEGEPISAGTVTGRIKVLHFPDEKPLLPGEIMVARATDPGWTTLFVNAGGIILEIGGMVQHGAVVAREYGKPCIAGIENATSFFKDGQTVEMDGIQGIIRIIDSKG